MMEMNQLRALPKTPIVGRGPELRELEDWAVEQYDALTTERQMAEPAIDLMKGRDTVRAYAAELWSVLLQTAPTGSEVVISTRLKDGTTFVGTLDVLVEGGFGDRKTGRPWDERRADESRQFSGYALLYWKRFGGMPDRVFVDSLTEGNRGVTSKRVETRRTVDDCLDYEDVVVRVRRGIEAGMDLPAPEGCWWCTAKWCPHFRNCVAVRGRSQRC